MWNRWQYFRPVLAYLGLLISVFGLRTLMPLAVRAVWESLEMRLWWIIVFLVAEYPNLRKALKFLHKRRRAGNERNPACRTIERAGASFSVA